MRNFIPGSKVNHSRLRKSENRLEFPDSSCCIRTIKTIHCNSWNGTVNGGNGIQLLLYMTDFVTGRTNGQIITRPGCRNAGNLFCCVNVNRRTVKMPEDFNRAVTAFAQRAGTPLGQPDCKSVYTLFFLYLQGNFR